jgi:hypothetical protein
LRLAKPIPTGKRYTKNARSSKSPGSGPFLPTRVLDYPASISGYERESLAEAKLAAQRKIRKRSQPHY